MVCTIPVCGQFAALLVSTDFTDDMPLNRLQLALYGFQQSVVGLGADRGRPARGVAPDETDMFGTPPPTREEMMRHFRENGRDAGPRFSVNPNLRADIDAALANRQAEILAQAVKVQTGLEFDEMENAYGIDLSLTLQSLAENTFAKPPSGGAADGAAAAAQPAGDTVYEDGDSAAARVLCPARKRRMRLAETRRRTRSRRP